MGMDAVEVHIGTANIGFGWAAFALALLGSTAIAAIVIAEWGIEAAQAKVLEKTEDVMEKATGAGGRFSTVDIAGGVSRPEEARASLGTTSMRDAVVDRGMVYGGRMLKSSLRRS